MSNPAAPMSLREYARHRAELGLVGTSAQAVSQAVMKGRLVRSVVRDHAGAPKIIDPELADREWSAGTDHSKAPPGVKERASAQPQQAKPGAARPPAATAPPSDGADDRTEEPDHLSLSLESAREKYWKANKAEIEYRERIGQLVDAEEMKAAVADAFMRVRSRLAGLPTRMRQQIPHLTVDDVGLVDSFVREALDELALKLEDEEDDEEVDEPASAEV